MRGTENPHCSKQTMQSSFFFFFFLSPITLCWSLFTHSCRRRAGGGEGGNKGTDEHPHDKEASPSAGARTSAYFSLESIVAKWPTCKYINVK